MLSWGQYDSERELWDSLESVIEKDSVDISSITIDDNFDPNNSMIDEQVYEIKFRIVTASLGYYLIIHLSMLHFPPLTISLPKFINPRKIFCILIRFSLLKRYFSLLSKKEGIFS